MKKSFSFLLLSTLFTSGLAHADTATGNTEATAQLDKSCYIEVDDLAFGDVTQQTMVGSGVVVANTELRLLCTKNASVLFSVQEGMGEAYLENDTEVVPYELSMTSDFTEVMMSNEQNNALTYTQNDGQYQGFPLYGRIDVSLIKPGAYVDTNSVILHF